MTRKTLEKLTEKQLKTVKDLKSRYHDGRLKKENTRSEMRGYVKGLADAGIISERESQVVFCYMTI